MTTMMMMRTQTINHRRPLSAHRIVVAPLEGPAMPLAKVVTSLLCLEDQVFNFRMTRTIGNWEMGSKRLVFKSMVQVPVFLYKCGRKMTLPPRSKSARLSDVRLGNIWLRLFNKIPNTRECILTTGCTILSRFEVGSSLCWLEIQQLFQIFG